MVNASQFKHSFSNTEKHASQSSVGWGGLPARGIDGRISGTWSKGTCTHSANAGSNQWRVELLDHYDVDSVVIFNRMDCCQNRINGAKVRNKRSADKLSSILIYRLLPRPPCCSLMLRKFKKYRFIKNRSKRFIMIFANSLLRHDL